MNELPSLGLPLGHYGAILADPPWRFENYNEKGGNRNPDWRRFKGSPVRHYETMALEDLRLLPVEDLAARDAVLFLWISWPLLQQAIWLMGAWGFEYKTCAFCWTKAHTQQVDMFRDDADALMGTGYWTRANTEACLLATRGHPKRLHADVRQAIIAPRREHSRKPDGIHERIERLVAGPYLELFARETGRPGWDFWGNQKDRFKSSGVSSSVPDTSPEDASPD